VVIDAFETYLSINAPSLRPSSVWIVPDAPISSVSVMFKTYGLSCPPPLPFGVPPCLMIIDMGQYTTKPGILQDDLERVKVAGSGRVDITVGSALDIFGGALPFQAVVDWHKIQRQ
jgi:hypothetical protein